MGKSRFTVALLGADTGSGKNAKGLNTQHHWITFKSSIMRCACTAANLQLAEPVNAEHWLLSSGRQTRVSMSDFSWPLIAPGRRPCPVSESSLPPRRPLSIDMADEDTSFPLPRAEVRFYLACADELDDLTLWAAHCPLSRVSAFWRLRRPLLHLNMDSHVQGEASWPY